LQTSYLEDTGRCDLRVRHRKPGNARTEMTRRPAVQIRPFRIFVIAELVDGEKYAAVSDSEVDCDLGNGVKSREPTSGDPCCRGSMKYAYSVTPVTWLATGAAFSDSPHSAGHEALLQSTMGSSPDWEPRSAKPNEPALRAPDSKSQAFAKNPELHVASGLPAAACGLWSVV
jgi:hypothetical protein